MNMNSINCVPHNSANKTNSKDNDNNDNKISDKIEFNEIGVSLLPSSQPRNNVLGENKFSFGKDDDLLY